MSMNNFPRVFLNSKEEKEIQQGFPWVFDNEISHVKHRADEKSEWKNESLKECTVEDGATVTRALVAENVSIGKKAKVGNKGSEEILLVAKNVKGGTK